MVDFPTYDSQVVYTKLEEEMKNVRANIQEGLALRARAGVKVRQPLKSATVLKCSKEMAEVVAEELNVKEVKFGEEVSLDFEITPELKQEGLMREVVRVVQSARKSAGLNVDDRIKLNLSSESAELKEVINKFKDEIATEVLAEEWSDTKLKYTEEVKVEGSDLSLSLEKT